MEKIPTYSDELWYFSRFNPRYVGARKMKLKKSLAGFWKRLRSFGADVAVLVTIADFLLHLLQAFL